MKGNVIGFDPDTNTGAVSGHDGNRYDFTMADWRGGPQPRQGDIVDFQAQGQRALDIYLLEPEYVAPSFGQFYFSYHGRISRSQFWLRWILPLILISVISTIIVSIFTLGYIGTSTDEKSEKLFEIILTYMLIFTVATLWTDCVVLAKRMHDRNKPGWLVFFCLGPRIASMILPSALSVIFSVVGLIIFIWFFVEFGCLRGTIGENRFGPDPVR